MRHRVLVITTTATPGTEVVRIVRAYAGDDAEVHVIAPASKISRLDWLTNAEDDARADAAERAEATAAGDADAEPHVGDVDPMQAIEDALRMFPAEEIVVLTEPDDGATWLENGLGEAARERFALPVTHLVTADPPA
jgi:hypothetical protein